jgi:tetratricopeptide (TPR) repeat protein
MRLRARARAITTAVALAVAVAQPSAHAFGKPAPADLKRAEELYDNGRALFAEGSYAAAATAFEEAYGLSGNLDMLYNAALAHDRAGDFEAAITALDRYRALAPASEREALDQRKKSLQLRLDKQREAEAKAAAEPDGTTGPPPPEEDRLMPEPTPPTERKPKRVRPVTWGLLGGSAAGFVVMAGLGGASLARTNAAKDGCIDGDAGLLCGSDVADDARKSRPLAIGADVMLGISAALAVAFIAMLAVDLRKSKRRDIAHVRPTTTGLAVRF